MIGHVLLTIIFWREESGPEKRETYYLQLDVGK